MKKLIIAEKPSVAADIARALGKAKKTDDYYENEVRLVRIKFLCEIAS